MAPDEVGTTEMRKYQATLLSFMAKYYTKEGSKEAKKPKLTKIGGLMPSLMD